MLKKVTCLEEEKILYEYFKKISPEIPTYFPIDFDTWRESMFNDSDDYGPWFYELETYMLYEENILKGFIQYGLTNFIFVDTNNAYSELDYTKHYALIRNMHYAKDSKNPEELMEAALNYFKENESKFVYPTEKPAWHLNEITAYFHGFGMQCYARHTKLHESQFYIEELLDKYSFINNEKNVYFLKDLGNCDIYNDSEITCEIELVSSFEFIPNSSGMKVKFILGGEEVGDCSLAAVQETIYYLVWFGIHEQYQKRGIGARCLNNIFYMLKEKNVQKFATDTYADNFAAQALYTKTGFINKGITKSYAKRM